MVAINFSLAQIEAFASVSETGSLSLAAKRLQKNRTTVSELVDTLEINLGYSLFDRSKRPLQLTEEGQHLYAQARLFLQEATAFNQIAMQMPENIQQTLTICYDCFTPFKLLCSIASFFNKIRININFLCIERTQAELLLADGRAEIGIYQAKNRMINDSFKWRALGTVELGVYAGTDFFASKTNIITMLELVTKKQLIPFQELPDYLAKKLKVADAIQKVTDILLLKELLKNNFGWAILPTHLFDKSCDAIKRYDTELGDKGMTQTLVALWLPTVNQQIGQIIQQLSNIYDSLYCM